MSLQELKQDVSSFRYEILNNLKSHRKDYKQELTAIKEQQNVINDKLGIILFRFGCSKPPKTVHAEANDEISKL